MSRRRAVTSAQGYRNRIIERASRALTQLYDRELRSAGLNMPQFTCLRTLATAGAITRHRIRQILVLDSVTLNRTLRSMEKKGWVRTRPGKDRSERQIRLTAAGRAKLRLATPAWDCAQQRVLARIGQKRLKALMAELTAIVALTRQR
jgi:DNA-binding MarR family transcriptional regulator